MDSFFGIGSAELVIILIFAGLVLGPHQIRKIAHQLGYWSTRFRRIYQQFISQLNDELDVLDDDGIKAAVEEVRNIGKHLDEVKKDIRQTPFDLRKETKAALSDAKDVVQNGMDASRAIAPPRPVEVEGDPSL